MTTPSVENKLTNKSLVSDFPDYFFNCFEIANPDQLAWDVNAYTFTRIDDQELTHKDRSNFINSIWELRKQYKDKCPGYSFVTDIDEQTVVVSSKWDIPSGIEIGDYYITYDQTFTTQANNPEHHYVIQRILSEAIKKHFKDNPNSSLGSLWQDFKSFCQIPDFSEKEDFLFCRRFFVLPKTMLDGRFVFSFIITTATLDSNSFGDYFLQGRIIDLAKMIESKQKNKTNRKGESTAVRVLHVFQNGIKLDAKVMELNDPDLIISSKLCNEQEQRNYFSKTIKCKQYNKPPVDITPGELYLILDPKITQAEHQETIVDPEERVRLLIELQKFFNNIDVFGKKVILKDNPLDAGSFHNEFIRPPAVRVRGENDSIVIIDSPSIFSYDKIKERGLQRSRHIQRYGFLQSRPIIPAIAWPENKFTKQRAERFKTDINNLCKKRNLQCHFEDISYKNINDLRRKLEANQYNALLCVLPEGYQTPYHSNDTHEQIKKQIPLPSQCIHYDNTIPESWAYKTPNEFLKSNPKIAGRIRTRYEICIDNLLLKQGWLPFLPSTPFHFNVHVGIDVGGVDNNQAMACIGYGLTNPQMGLIFRLEEIPIEISKAEPIPTKNLRDGLLHIFEFVHTELAACGEMVNFDKVIFFRDGKLQGSSDNINEKCALIELHHELTKRNWITEESSWAAVEIHKRGENLRLFQKLNNKITNPLVGHCVVGFEDEDEALVCTTGNPYLTQGTANPLIVRKIIISGNIKMGEILEDTIWAADLGYSKPNMSIGLPWVLNVADSGALQAARSYIIPGN